MDRLEQFAQSRTMQRGDVHRLGPVDEAELALHQRVGLLALVVALAVPLVDGHDQRAAGIEHRAEHRCVLVGHAFAGIEHDHRDLAVLDRLQRLDDRELLDRFLDLAATTQAGGVDQAVLAAIALEVDRDRIAGRARHVGGDHPLLAEDAVHQRRLADIGTADERDADAFAGRCRGFRRRRPPATPPARAQAARRCPACAPTTPENVLDAVAREFSERRLRVDAVGLVDDEEGRRGDLAQPRQDVVIQRRRAFAPIDDEQDEVGFLRRGARLPGGGAGKAFVAAIDAAGVDKHKGCAGSSRQTP